MYNDRVISARSLAANTKNRHRTDVFCSFCQAFLTFVFLTAAVIALFNSTTCKR